MELLITFVVVVVICAFLYWLAGQLPPPVGRFAQIAVIAGACLWLILHLREIVGAIAHS